MTSDEAGQKAALRGIPHSKSGRDPAQGGETGSLQGSG